MRYKVILYVDTREAANLFAKRFKRYGKVEIEGIKERKEKIRDLKVSIGEIIDKHFSAFGNVLKVPLEPLKRHILDAVKELVIPEEYEDNTGNIQKKDKGLQREYADGYPPPMY